ncbi:hypothetical protein MTO96_025761 [Rhipicephalus appendiculatus]
MVLLPARVPFLARVIHGGTRPLHARGFSLLPHCCGDVALKVSRVDVHGYSRSPWLVAFWIRICQACSLSDQSSAAATAFPPADDDDASKSVGSFSCAPLQPKRLNRNEPSPSASPFLP